MSRQPSPTATSGPITQYGPISAPAPIAAPGATRAVGSIALIRRSCVRDHRADLGLGDDLPGNLGLAAEPPHGLPLGDLGHVIFDGVARDHRLAEFRLVEGDKIDGLPLALPAEHMHADHARRLRHALDHQHAGKHWIARKMTEELRLIIGDVLNSDGEFVAPYPDDAVDHQKRVTMRE